MKIHLALLTSLLLLAPGLLRAQYKIDWFHIGGGGGQATGGVYAIAGSIGQPDMPDIGTASGGPFVLSSGYWAMIGIVPTAGAPRLDFARIGDTLQVSWPLTPGLILQEADGLDEHPNVQWRDVSLPYTTNGSRVFVTFPLSDTNAGLHAAGGQIKIPAKKVVKFR